MVAVLCVFCIGGEPSSGVVPVGAEFGALVGLAEVSKTGLGVSPEVVSVRVRVGTRVSGQAFSSEVGALVGLAEVSKTGLGVSPEGAAVGALDGTLAGL